ncbi:hypothetical protein SAY86_018180 [Trapa natans]|uniref:Bifunctional inhibitor/plant lipid transfer protein/seed storage helical domain-containing protein n=1 Tax=Trapa natans TaxID=22666 RepID=A0AAN7QYJ8_TRANT|nr:hypothetical protein SAY86_018180 [Trapa natans]
MKLALALVIVSLLAAFHGPTPSGAAHHHSVAPAPAVDCTTLILDKLYDCLSFVSINSTITKPEGTCCTGLKTVLSTHAECLCEVYKSSSATIFPVNITKTLTLPSVCKLSTPSVSCLSSLLPPAASPGPGSSSPAAPGPVAGAPSATGGNMTAPNQAPGNSAPASLIMSLGYLISALATSLVLNNFM